MGGARKLEAGGPGPRDASTFEAGEDDLESTWEQMDTCWDAMWTAM